MPLDFAQARDRLATLSALPAPHSLRERLERRNDWAMAVDDALQARLPGQPYTLSEMLYDTIPANLAVIVHNDDISLKPELERFADTWDALQELASSRAMMERLEGPYREILRRNPLGAITESFERYAKAVEAFSMCGRKLSPRQQALCRLGPDLLDYYEFACYGSLTRQVPRLLERQFGDGIETKSGLEHAKDSLTHDIADLRAVLELIESGVDQVYGKALPGRGRG